MMLKMYKVSIEDLSEGYLHKPSHVLDSVVVLAENEGQARVRCNTVLSNINKEHGQNHPYTYMNFNIQSVEEITDGTFQHWRVSE
jgi:hypothetical protein